MTSHPATAMPNFPEELPRWVTAEKGYVHIDRFVTNLKRQLEAKPDDAWLHYEIGRLYALAFAGGSDEFLVEKGWADYVDKNPEFIPKTTIILRLWEEDFSVPPRSNLGFDTLRQDRPNPPAFLDAEQREDYIQRWTRRKVESREMLDFVIPYYREAYRLDPENNVFRLGLAWALHQDDQLQEAAESYRELLSDMLDEHEENLARLRETGTAVELARFSDQVIPNITIIRETSDALKSILGEPLIRESLIWGALFDRAERLQGEIAKHHNRGAISPIAIPLTATTNHDSLLNPSARVKFNLDGLSDETEWTWITPEAGWLVWDPSGDGVIESGKELFGNVTFWVFWRNGYEALAALDDNQDGRIAGAEMDGLAIWRDANSNGISELGEVKPVAAWGIRALSTQWLDHDQAAAWNPEGVEFDSGEIRPTYDVLLHQWSANHQK